MCDRFGALIDRKLPIDHLSWRKGVVATPATFPKLSFENGVVVHPDKAVRGADEGMPAEGSRAASSELYDLAGIVGIRRTAGLTEFRVRWRHHGPRHDEWKTAEDVRDLRVIYDAFLELARAGRAPHPDADFEEIKLGVMAAVEHDVPAGESEP